MCGNTEDKLFSVEGKVVAITGAAGIIYSCIGRGLAERGAKVALLNLMVDKAQEIADQIVADGGEAIAVKCNVLEEASVQAALDTVLAKWGQVDALINGAGGNRKGAVVPPDGKFTDLDLNEMDFVFALNYKGTFLPTQIFCKYFAERGEGAIINTSSMSAILPLTNVPGYSNAKAAVTNFTRWLAVPSTRGLSRGQDPRQRNRPGFLDTNQNHRLLFEEDDKTLTVRGQSILDHTPLRRFGDPAELLGPVILLLSEAGNFLHGVTLPVDGGFAVCCGVGPLNEKCVSK